MIISRAKRAGLIEAKCKLGKSGVAGQFPAQNARASLKPGRRPPNRLFQRQFPAQNARASLKLRRCHCGGWRCRLISRAKRAGLIEAIKYSPLRLTAARISRAKRAGLIEAPLQFNQWRPSNEISRAKRAGLIEARRIGTPGCAGGGNFPRKTRGPH